MANVRLSLDRFEGRDKELAVLVSNAGEETIMPRRLLPADCKGGDVMILAVSYDREATEKVAKRARELQRRSILSLHSGLKSVPCRVTADHAVVMG